jgi:RND family efflux transporter MFP subunit
LLCVLPAAFSSRDESLPAPNARAAITVTASALRPTELAKTVTANGTIHAWEEIVIGPEVGGYRVAQVNVDVGDRVTVGQELVRLSSKLLEAEVASKEAVLKQREAELVNAEAAYRRGKELSPKGALSAAELDRLNSESLAAQARLDSAQADLDTSRLRLEFTRVTAPDDGIVTARDVNVGQIAQAGGEMLRLMRQGRLEWRGEVPEGRLNEIKPGQTAHVSTASGLRLEGRVRIVGPTVERSNRTGLVYVDVNSGHGVLPGMFARGAIEVGRGKAHMAPLASIVTADGYDYVFVLKPDFTVERRRVEIGVVQDAFVEIVTGVKPGERIVDSGAGFLKDGDLVNVVRSDLDLSAQ